MSEDASPTIPAPDTEDSAAEAAPTVEEDAAPVGTMFFMILFLLVMVGLWVTAYWMLLER